MYTHINTQGVGLWGSQYLLDGKAQVQASQLREMVTEFEAVELRWMSLEPVTQSEVSQRKTNIV